jgi:hypothetical protein
MVWAAAAWSGFGALSWLWAVPFIKGKAAVVSGGFTVIFLALAFFPGLLFCSLFHVGDPDHTLSIVPVTCIAGGLAITAFTRRFSAAKRTFTIAICIVVNVFLFIKPISNTTLAATYKPVRWMKDYIRDVIEGVETLSANGPVTVVFEKDVTGWRHLSYYNPRVQIVVVNSGQSQPVILPSCGTLVWVDPAVRPVAAGGIPIQSTHSRVFFTPAVRGASYQFHGIQFIVAGTGCGEPTP